MEHETESRMHRCPRCGRKMKSNEKHSCGLSPAKGEDNGSAMQDRIRARAYDLYLARGREDGHASEDWARAEKDLREGAKPEKGC